MDVRRCSAHGVREKQRPRGGGPRVAAQTRRPAPVWSSSVVCGGARRPGLELFYSLLSFVFGLVHLVCFNSFLLGSGLEFPRTEITEMVDRAGRAARCAGCLAMADVAHPTPMPRPRRRRRNPRGVGPYTSQKRKLPQSVSSRHSPHHVPNLHKTAAAQLSSAQRCTHCQFPAFLSRHAILARETAHSSLAACSHPLRRAHTQYTIQAQGLSTTFDCTSSRAT